ncbi:MAG: efflux transporter outer membrane subunit [Xanthomonadaceae bacterium]|nr:efflux transporter outer membrane subunit [Xanthomonadaceae bacterium]MDE1960560.1 efflux transporter outer membrane subunit [Xanthomonadaceae bacterium]
MTASLRWLLAIAASALVAGCAIPPRPAHPDVAHAALLAGIESSSTAAWPDRAWWTRYHDAQLDDLQARALRDAPTLVVARARLDQAERYVDVARADAGATVSGNAQLQRDRLSEQGLIPSQFLGFNWYGQGDLGLSFNYDFDFWGSHGADIAAATDRARAAAAERDSAASMIAAAVADTYFGWQADQARLAIAREIVAGYTRGRTIAAARAHQGLDANDVVHRADAELAAAREQVAMLEGDTRIQLAALAGLLGVAPADLPKLTAHSLPPATAALPANAGLDLIARRADVAASRWRVEAALKDVDVARAAFYPDVSLSAMAGFSSIDLGKLLSPGSTVFAAGPALHLPIFEGGRLRARFGVSQAALAAAVADYRAAVVDAAREVSAQALKLRQIQERRQQSAEQLAAKAQLLASARARMRQGLSDAVPALDAGETLDRQRDASVQLDAAALSAEIALTRALGGGYGTEASASQSTSGAASP